MSFISRHQKETFFITRDFNQKITSKSNIILSPEFYWAKKVALNVHFAYEVKKMAPSLFDGALPSGDFEYTVFKISKNNYIVVAYDILSIKEKLRQLGIKTELIERVYIAQSEFGSDDISLRVNDTCGMTMLDGVLVYTCLSFIDSDIMVEDVIKNRKLTKNYIYSKQITKIEPKQLTLLIWMIFLMSSILVLDIAKLYKSDNQLSTQKEDFIRENSLPQTSYQLKSVQDELQSIDKTQTDLRESIYYVNKFKLNKTEFFENITFSKNSLNYKLKTKKQKEFKKYLSKEEKSSISVGTSL